MACLMSNKRICGEKIFQLLSRSTQEYVLIKGLLFTFAAKIYGVSFLTSKFDLSNLKTKSIKQNGFQVKF